ncbi:MAG TPA: hypothetical protein VLG10_00080 [Methylomirabilota bacterium]|nr:hypothetical protein [Methylomirabilota bacterium]
MNRLTPQERRRVYLAQQRARNVILARLNTPATSAAGADDRGRGWLITAAMIATLLGGSVLASQTFEFHLPTGLVEALLPRL